MNLVSRIRNSLTFSGRGIPAGGVAPRSHIPDILARRALPAGRRAPENLSPNFELGTLASSWAERASSRYDEAYAKRYRAHDDEFQTSEPCREFAAWLQRICAAFEPPIDVLDLGCGTGRYFWTLTGVRDLVGIDASPSMLAEASVPYNAGQISARSITLIEGDLLSHQFDPARFDLVYSIGVLAEHVPFDEAVVEHVSRWLKPRGRFAFTTVHPQSPSVPRTMARRIGGWLEPFFNPREAGAVGRYLRTRLLAGGLYADEARVGELVAGAFEIESLERFESEAHLHCLCVARKAPAAAATSKAEEQRRAGVGSREHQ